MDRLVRDRTERVLQNVDGRPCSKICSGHPVMQLDGVITYLKRYGRTSIVLQRGAVSNHLAVRLHTDRVRF